MQNGKEEKKLTKKFYLEQIEKLGRWASLGQITFHEAELSMYRETEHARKHLDTHEWISVKRKMYRTLLNLAKGI